MSTSTKISIAMAVYNGECFIRDQLDSFLRQTRCPDELVVSDNASIDSTVNIVHDFAKHAPFPVRVLINERNLGVTKNFERAIRECTGDVIFLSDCDDVWYTRKIAVMREALARWPQAGAAICEADFVDEELCPITTRSFWALRELAYRPWVRRGSFAQGKCFNHYLVPTGNCLAFRAQFRSLIIPLPECEEFRHGGHDYFIAWVIACSGAAGIIPVREIARLQAIPKLRHGVWGKAAMAG